MVYSEWWKIKITTKYPYSTEYYKIRKYKTNTGLHITWICTNTHYLCRGMLQPSASTMWRGLILVWFTNYKESLSGKLIIVVLLLTGEATKQWLPIAEVFLANPNSIPGFALIFSIVVMLPYILHLLFYQGVSIPMQFLPCLASEPLKLAYCWRKSTSSFVCDRLPIRQNEWSSAKKRDLVTSYWEVFCLLWCQETRPSNLFLGIFCDESVITFSIPIELCWRNFVFINCGVYNIAWMSITSHCNHLT